MSTRVFTVASVTLFASSLIALVAVGCIGEDSPATDPASSSSGTSGTSSGTSGTSSSGTSGTSSGTSGTSGTSGSNDAGPSDVPDAALEGSTSLGTKWLKATLTGADAGGGSATLHLTYYQATEKLCGRLTFTNLPTAHKLTIYDDGFPALQFFSLSASYPFTNALSQDQITAVKNNTLSSTDITDANDNVLVGGALVPDPAKVDDPCQ